MGDWNPPVENHAMRVLLAVLLLSAVAVAEDKTVTLKEVKAAAEGGDKDAQCELDIFCTPMAKTSPKTTAKRFRKAAEQGHSKSQCSLGVMYQYGRGVSQSDIEAYARFSVSTTNGYEDAEQFLSEVKAELTPEQLGTAEERATAHEFSIRA